MTIEGGALGMPVVWHEDCPGDYVLAALTGVAAGRAASST